MIFFSLAWTNLTKSEITFIALGTMSAILGLNMTLTPGKVKKRIHVKQIEKRNWIKKYAIILSL